MKILIADDEMEARALLLYYLQQMKVHVQVREAIDGKQTIAMLDEFVPDILFLDIKMPECTGIQLLESKEPSTLPVVILTTAYDEYALPAFDYEVVDYLLKPFDGDRFEKAMNRAINYVSFLKGRSNPHYLQSLPVKTGTKTTMVPVSEIEYFQSEGPYVEAVAENKTWLLGEPLYELEVKLNPSQFLRIHRSTIVNLHSIVGFQSLSNGDQEVLLKSGKVIRASRTYREKIRSFKQK